jgi:CRISPR/Cas system-associated endonuclease Cas3-HD
MGYYWENNKIYIIITIAILCIWLFAVSIMFIDIQIQIAATSNDTCSNPVAMYFDKANREKCLRLAAEKKSNVVHKVTDTFNKNVEGVIKKTENVLNQIKSVENHYNGIQERKEKERAQKIETAQKMYNEVYNLVNKIRKDYKENQDSLVKLVDYYENTFEYNQKIMVELASQLVNKLVANTFTKKYDTQRQNMVNSYDKIKQFLETFSKEKIPELPRDARKGKK